MDSSMDNQYSTSIYISKVDNGIEMNSVICYLISFTIPIKVIKGLCDYGTIPIMVQVKK